MKYFLYLSCFFLFFQEINAQNKTLGLRYNTLFSSNRNFNTFTQTSKESTLDFDFFWTEQVKNLLIVSKLGFYRNNKSTDYSSSNPFLTSETQSQVTIIGYKLSLGLEKLYQYQKINFYTGIEIPFQFRPSYNYTSAVHSTFSTVGTASYSRTESSHPPTIIYGINLLGRVYYQLGKISIGIDLSTGIQYQFSPPNFISVERIYDENDFLMSETETEIQQRRYSLRQLNNFSIGIQYHFGLNKKEKKNIETVE